MPQYLCFGRLRDHRVHGCRRRSLRRLQRINGKETGASHHRIQDADIKRMMLRQTVHWLFFASGGWWWLALALLYLTQGLISRKIKSLSAKKQLQCPIYLGMRRKISGGKKKFEICYDFGLWSGPVISENASVEIFSLCHKSAPMPSTTFCQRCYCEGVR